MADNSLYEILKKTAENINDLKPIPLDVEINKNYFKPRTNDNGKPINTVNAYILENICYMIGVITFNTTEKIELPPSTKLIKLHRADGKDWNYSINSYDYMICHIHGNPPTPILLRLSSNGQNITLDNNYTVTISAVSGNPRSLILNSFYFVYKLNPTINDSLDKEIISKPQK